MLGNKRVPNLHLSHLGNAWLPLRQGSSWCREHRNASTLGASRCRFVLPPVSAPAELELICFASLRSGPMRQRPPRGWDKLPDSGHLVGRVAGSSQCGCLGDPRVGGSIRRPPLDVSPKSLEESAQLARKALAFGRHFRLPKVKASVADSLTSLLHWAGSVCKMRPEHCQMFSSWAH